MLSKITRTKSARKTLLYSETKLTEGKASLLAAENFLKNKESLSFHEKLDRLQDLASLNDTAEKKIAHIFLTFHRQDQLSDKHIVELAKRYMDSAGMGRQPYLVYRHFDTWHPHAHIVSSFILPSGKLLDLKRDQLRELVQFTKTLEDEFSLVKNGHIHEEVIKNMFNEEHAQKIMYGQLDSMSAITSVLKVVLEKYKFHTLDEYNALLRECNLKAEKGNVGTRLYNNKGLAYVVLDEDGHRISRGIKASAFYLKPTLSNLEKKFTLNASSSDPSRQRIQTAIEWTLAGKAPDWKLFQDSLCKEGINVLVQEKEKGYSPEIYFIDHQEKAVFSGESLGSQYTLSALQQRFVQHVNQEEVDIQKHHLRLHL